MARFTFSRLDEQPLISILLPVLNGDSFLRDAVSSVLRQSYTNWELLIIDDNSSDRSVEISLEFAKRNPNISLIRNDGSGLPAALNCGIKAAQGQLIARMDADDICLKERLRKQVKRFHLNDQLAILGSSAVLVESNGTISGHHLAFPSPLVNILMLYECSLIHPSVMIRKEVFDFIGAYNLEYKTAQDYELWLRALSKGLQFDNVAQPLIVMRKSNKSNSRKDPDSHKSRVKRLKKSIQKQLPVRFFFVRCVGFTCRLFRLFYRKLVIQSSAINEAKEVV